MDQAVAGRMLVLSRLNLVFLELGLLKEASLEGMLPEEVSILHLAPLRLLAVVLRRLVLVKLLVGTLAAAMLKGILLEKVIFTV